MNSNQVYAHMCMLHVTQQGIGIYTIYNTKCCLQALDQYKELCNWFVP